MIKGVGRKQQQFYIKKYNDNEYRIVALQSVREKGLEKETLEEERERKYFETIEAIEDMFAGRETRKNVSCETYEKLQASISRTKRLVYDYAKCNEWQYWVTLTIDKEKCDRYNLRAIYERMHKMITKINQSVNVYEEWGRREKIEYLFVPEMHKDGAYHMHGFIKGLHKTDIRINEHGKQEWKQWRDNFGFCNIEKIKDKDRICSYVTKYVTKDLKKAVKEKGAHMFYASKGLKKPEIIYQGGGAYIGEYDFIHEKGYCAIVTVTKEMLDKNFKNEEEIKNEYERKEARINRNILGYIDCTPFNE